MPGNETSFGTDGISWALWKRRRFSSSCLMDGCFIKGAWEPPSQTKGTDGEKRGRVWGASLHRKVSEGQAKGVTA